MVNLRAKDGIGPPYSYLVDGTVTSAVHAGVLITYDRMHDRDVSARSSLCKALNYPRNCP